MSIGELANYAEVVGGGAVIISLIYVAIQIRQNTAVVRTSNYADLSFKVSEFNQLIAENGELAEIYTRGTASYKELSEIEQIRFNMTISRLMQAVQAMFHLRQRGYIDSKLAQTNFDSVALFLAAPGLQEWWQDNKQWWESEFQHFVNEMIDTGKQRLS